MEKSITLTIDLEDPNAPMQVEANGFRGTGCKAVTQAFARALGTTVSSTDKPEMFQSGAGNMVVSRQ